MIVFDIPKVILQSREKVKIFNFLDFDHVWSLWTLYVCSGDMCMLQRHVSAVETWYMFLGQGICSWDMVYAVWTRDMLYGHVFLLEKNIWCLVLGEEYMVSSSWRRIYGVFLLEKNIWIWKMSSCWIRIYGYGRCILVG